MRIVNGTRQTKSNNELMEGRFVKNNGDYTLMSGVKVHAIRINAQFEVMKPNYVYMTFMSSLVTPDELVESLRSFANQIEEYGKTGELNACTISEYEQIEAKQ